MTKVKNDPNRYVKRASLIGRSKGVFIVKEISWSRRVYSERRERDFLSATIDDGLYVDFRPKRKQ